MLACYPRRQYPHQPFRSAALPSSPSHHNLNHFDALPYTTLSPSDLATTFRNQLFDSAPASTPSLLTEPFYPVVDQYVHSVYQSQNPPIRVQQSTSTSQPLTDSYQSSMQFDSGASSQVWHMYEDNDGPASADVALQTPG
ncbi:hypothetical protein B0A49_13320, partial [Cryomyces minteri]